ncbi:hypothetical protein EMWEY_00020140 [Eimeria maxima]|uniref:Uncharacterized protein n=1 Tax=Eimeria maxima TaxID=5804 RepID=U6M545_EIMMA|nr:hypothetical protein EMWEY_00020140 [Eimeria maxima]CDJ59141.1 hypothetical protein EMWEY_00020140 [Eimeria maxima]
MALLENCLTYTRRRGRISKKGATTLVDPTAMLYPDDSEQRCYTISVPSHFQLALNGSQPDQRELIPWKPT